MELNTYSKQRIRNGILGQLMLSRHLGRWNCQRVGTSQKCHSYSKVPGSWRNELLLKNKKTKKKKQQQQQQKVSWKVVYENVELNTNSKQRIRNGILGQLMLSRHFGRWNRQRVGTSQKCHSYSKVPGSWRNELLLKKNKKQKNNNNNNNNKTKTTAPQARPR